jgi:hypothetical protein
MEQRMAQPYKDAAVVRKHSAFNYSLCEILQKKTNASTVA